MRVLLQVPLSPYSGYGNDGIGLARAFMRAGADVYIAPAAVQPPLPRDIHPLLGKESSQDFDLYISHLDPTLLECADALRQHAETTVGWTMWEYSSFDNLHGGTEKLARSYRNFDALVGYDEPTTDGFRPYLQDSQALLTLQGGFDPTGWEYMERDWEGDRFGFCMNGALSLRKDPFVAIEAFRQLKEEHPEEFEPAELHLKTSIMSLHPGLEEVIPKLRVHYDIWPVEVLKEFYAAQHCLLAPSRGEGKNVPALEFQSTGGVVIATNWGGHKPWLHTSYAYPLEYELQPAEAAFPDALNARASVEHLKQQMLHVFRNRSEARNKGRLASQIIPQTKSWDVVVDRLLRELKTTVPNGERLYQKAQFAAVEASNGRS